MSSKTPSEYTFEIVVDDLLSASGSSSGTTETFFDQDQPKTSWSSTVAVPDRPASRYTKIYRSLRYWLFDRNMFWLMIWIYIQIALFLNYYIIYSGSPLYRTMRQRLGPGLPIARGAAGVLHFNCSVILLTMCRQTMTFLSKSRFIRRVLCLDSHKKMHRVIAISIVVFASLHVLAHVTNMLSLTKFAPRKPFVSYFVLSGPGWTGLAALLCLLIITLGSSFKRLINKKYELLVYSHYFIFPFIGFLQVHGTFCFITRDDATRCNDADFWKYSIFPLALYVFERLYLEIIGRRASIIHRVIRHPGKILEIQFKHKQSFSNGIYNIKPGQYVLINCPNISLLEWHPFTVTSAPEDQYVSVHIKCSGDWTSQLVRSMETSHHSLSVMKDELPRTLNIQEMLPRLNVSPAIFAPADQVFQYSVSLMIACGVGMTPYIAIMKAIKHRLKHPMGMKKLKKVYFVWVCRNLDDFECLVYFLKQMEEEGLDSVVNIALYWTLKTIRPSMCLDIHNRSMEGRDPITGLKAVTYFGRPRWKNILKILADKHFTEKKIGIFFCGPNALSKELMKQCSDTSHPNGPRLDFYPEVFA